MEVKFFTRHVFTLENLLALILAVILIAVIIFTTKSSPSWIYQGF